MENNIEQLNNLYNSIDNCKADGKLIKYVKIDIGSKCGYQYLYKLSNGIQDYRVRTFIKNTEYTGSECSNINYIFSGSNIPKVGDYMYVIGQYSSSIILNIGKETYNQYLDLPDCQIYSYGAPSYDEYLWADKCKVSGKIEEVARSFTDICGLNLGIKVKNGEETYIVGGREYFTGKDISLCLGAGDGWQQIDSTDGKITSQINKGDDFYAVLDQKDNTILRYGKEEYNADTSMPVCSGATEKQIQSFKGGITESELTMVMKAVEKEVERMDPFRFNFGKGHNVGRTETLSGTAQSSTGLFTTNTGKTTTINETKKEENTKIVYVKPKTNTVKVYSPKTMIISNTESKKIDTNSENTTFSTGNITKQETNSGSEIKEENISKETNTIKTETKVTESQKQEITGNTNYYPIVGGIIILVYLVFKKKKKN